MATTCDYCHKPLSLMRRLRGEQFCSVEHLDLYTAQQAEFARQRLAASVEDKPATQRPPALLKRIARTPVEANGHSNGKNGHGNGTLTKEAPPVELPSEDFLRVAGALSEPPILLRRIDPPLNRPSEPELPEIAAAPDVEYPMAGFVPDLPGPPCEPAEFPPNSVEPAVAESESLKPRLSLDPQAAPPYAPLQEFVAEPELEAPSILPSEAAEMNPAAAQFPQLHADPESVVASWSNERLIELFVAPAENTRRSSELLARPADLPAEFTAPKPDLSALYVDSSDLLIEPPAPASVRTTSLRLLSGHLKVAGLAEFARDAQFEPEIAAPQAETVSKLPLAARIPWTPTPLFSTPSFGSMFGALEPQLVSELPSVPEWSLSQSFVASSVALPETEPRCLPSGAALGDTAWVASSGGVQTPRMPASWPHFTKTGPNFGWELARPKSSLQISGLHPETATTHAVAEIVLLPDAPGARPALADLGNTSEQWSRPRSADPIAVTTEPNLTAPGLAPRVRDFRARVEARLDAVRRQEPQGWSNPRVDSTMLEPSVAANARPASSPVDLRWTPISNPSPAGLGIGGRMIPQRSMLTGPAVPMSELSSWAYPSGEPQPGISLEPTATLRPGKFSPNVPRSSERPATPLAKLQPVRYRAVSLVVVPPPNFRLQPTALTEETRFVALAPHGAYRLPRIRHTGYRMPGPYPKLPRQLPEQYLARPITQMPPPHFEVSFVWAHTRQDDESLPRLDAPVPTHIHPADYFTWPAIKTPRTDRILPAREYDTVLGPAVGANPTARRFGPARAGLQVNSKKADVLPRTGA